MNFEWLPEFNLDFFSGAVSNQCTVVLGSQPPVPATKRRRPVIESGDDQKDI